MRLLAALMLTALVPTVFADETAVDTAVVNWMQSTLAAWEDTCRKDLRISPDPLPWIIFYDSTRAWHVSPDRKRMPPHRKTRQALRFAGRRYPIFDITHTHELWVPGRNALTLKARAAAMPYDHDSKVFFVLAVPGLVAKEAGVPLSKDLSEFFAGTALHELTHTRHMLQLMPAINQLQARYKFPASIDDNLIEGSFAMNAEFRSMYQEAGRKMSAALTATDHAVMRENARKALQLVRQRQQRFFTGEYEGWGAMEEIWLTLEGAAMWVQFQFARKMAPPGEPWLNTISKLAQRADAWSQMEGLGLFLLMDRFDTSWPARFFSQSVPPSPLAFLETVLNSPPQQSQ